MLFRRRERPNLLERLRVSLWPRRSWGRSSRYVLFRISRLKATPYAIAMGAACGAFVSFTPFMGLHFLVGALLAWVMRASMIASALGTFIGNPLTFPFIWFGSYELGNWILGWQSTKTDIHLSRDFLFSSFEKVGPLIKPMVVGGIPMGLVAATICYFLVKRLAEAYQEKRRRNDVQPGPDKGAARA